ncbi:MAG: extracellular solute-binding protein [Phycisphaerae bacterium]|nr:extracellular solute-binding protein [Phycisphaerae bacterium]
MRHLGGVRLPILIVAAAAITAGVLAFRHYHRPEPKPTLRVFCGGSMRPPIEELIHRFEQRNNVRIEPIYNGCGTLVGQMKTGAAGDVYYSCDTSFMNDARSIGAIDESYPVANVTRFRPVIMVLKNNPRNIVTVDDLARPGLKIGLGVEDHGAVGRVGWQIVRASPKAEQIQKNIVTLAPTADFLCAQLATGNLDAVITWDAVARNYATCEMKDIPDWFSDQPIALMKKTANPELARRFIEFIRSAEARKVFAEHGFIVNQPTTQP